MGKFHVHDNHMFVHEECSATGGHYNPYGVTNGGETTHDHFEIGDLSGKHGKMNELSSDAEPHRTVPTVVTVEKYDYNLPVWGKHSVAGRSIVYHDDADNSRTYRVR